MKKAILMTVLMCAACTDLTGPDNSSGQLSISFANNLISETRVAAGIPDTDDFILSIIGSKGNTIYEGRFADSPEKIDVPADTYTVCAVSCEFDTPRYSSPQYGDTKAVTVSPGSSVSVELGCSQQNSGLKLGVSAEFRTLFPSATLYMEEDGEKLMFSYGESRTAYFKPGRVNVSMVDSDVEQPLFSRILEPRQMLAVTLTASNGAQGSKGISIQVDTARNWTSENYCYGESGTDGYSVGEAREMGLKNDVWVYGYIVGSFSSSSKCEFDPPFSKNTNIVLAGRTSVTDKTQCLSVELKSGEVRDVLNLMSNPDNKGRKIWLHGDLAGNYYGIPGLKNVSAFRWN